MRAVRISLAVLALLLAGSVIGGYVWQWPWVGVAPHLGQTHPTTRDYFQEKTLWDWLQLLVIPVALATLAAVFTRFQRAHELAIADQNRRFEETAARERLRAEVLRNYISDVSEIARTAQDWSNGTAHEAVGASLVRAHTVVASERLDGYGRGRIVQFLYELGALRVSAPLIAMHGVELTQVELADASLQGITLDGAKLALANLENAQLPQSGLRGANLTGANLRSANLSRAVLNQSTLTSTDLRHAVLTDAKCSSADFTGAKLTGAQLRGADLSDAAIVVAQLAVAGSVWMAIMPDGSVVNTDDASVLTGLAREVVAARAVVQQP